MSRRADPERIREAHRIGTLNRLIGDGELPDRAEALVAAWEAHLAEEGRPGADAYGEPAWEWMAARRRR